MLNKIIAGVVALLVAVWAVGPDPATFKDIQHPVVVTAMLWIVSLVVLDIFQDLK